MPTKNILLICLTLVFSIVFISSNGIKIKQATGALDSNGKITNTISTSGTGKSSSSPDMLKLNFSFSELDQKSSVALDKVNTKIAKSLEILKQAGIDQKDITTANLSIYPEYDWSNNQRKILGQRASQGIEVAIKKISSNSEKATKIIDSLSEIENIQIGNISFDIEDKTKLFTEARKLAFEKSKQKAQELANLSGVTLGKPVSVIDESYDVNNFSISNTAQYKAYSLVDMVAKPSTDLPTGQIDISSNLSIQWGIE